MKKKNLKNDIRVSRNLLLEAAKTDVEDILKQYGNTDKGFDDEKAEELRDTYGPNVITQKEKDGVIVRLLKAFFSPFTIILLILATISLFTNVIFAETFGETRDPTSVIIVVAMVFLSGLMRFAQETRSGNAAAKLKAMVKTTTCIIRNGEKVECPLEEVVVGDIIVLAAGDIIPADVRILSSKDLFISQSSLTGESNPVEKVNTTQSEDKKNALELPNLAFMGSNVISGSATAIVIATGDRTHFGALAKSLTGRRVPTNFDKGVSAVSWLLIRFMCAMVPIVFLINGITKGVIFHGGADAWLDALMFSLAIAVGLTPEMLPMIVTTGLAKGAIRMSHKKVVVKNLNAIQNFGAIDILCTDKTGTLTQDEIVLERYLDVNGSEDQRILKHAYLNSYFQTGMKNLMDKAILNHSKDVGVSEYAANYTKVDEIPFDFTRRRMSVVVKDNNGKTQLITKGAIEEILSICTYADIGGQAVPLTNEIRSKVFSVIEKYNEEGMRMLAVAQKSNPSEVMILNSVRLE